MKKLPMNQMLQIMFTEDEWDAIYNAMADYQDYGEEQAEIAHEIQHKISLMFQEGKWSFKSPRSISTSLDV